MPLYPCRPGPRTGDRRHAEASPCRNVGCVDWSRGDREVCRSSVYLLIWESRPKPGCRDKSSRLGAVRFLALIRIEIALTQTDRLRCDLDHFVIEWKRGVWGRSVLTRLDMGGRG